MADKYRIHPFERAVLTVNKEKRKGKKERRGPLSKPRVDEIGRRRLKGVAIQIYDLAQINTGTQQSPVWTDHAVLKTPGYTVQKVTPTTNAPIYRVDKFTEADFFSFTDSLFALGPVNEWKNIFRKLRFEQNPNTMIPTGYPATYPTEQRMRDKNNVTRDFFRDAPSGAANNVADHGYLWSPKGLEHANTLPKLWMFGAASPEKAWVSFNTDDNTQYKMTATYDPDAADVSGTIEIKGNIDAYLVPTFGLYFAVGAITITEVLPSVWEPVPEDGFNVVFGYQVTPRKLYPEYADPYNLGGFEIRTNYVEYQKDRTGMVGHFWKFIPGGGGDISHNPIDPTTWLNEIDSYKAVINNGATSYYGSTFTGVTGGGSTRFENFGTLYLMAVLKIKGVFYYLWAKDLGGNSLAQFDQPGSVVAWQVLHQLYQA